MESKIWRYYIPVSIWLFFEVLLAPLTAESYDRLCTVADNPLNVPFTVPPERLVDGRYSEIHSIGMTLIDPRDFGCKANHDAIMENMFKGALKCEVTGPTNVVCEVSPKCTAQRIKSLQRLREAALKTLDEVVIKIKAIKFFNDYLGVKKLIFGTEPLEKLSGLEIVARATTGPINIVTGYSVESKYPKPPRPKFDSIFKYPVDLYMRLYAAEEPTGLRQNTTCERKARKPVYALLDNEMFYCSWSFFYDLKKNKNLAPSDTTLFGLLEEAFKYIVTDLSGDRRRYRGIKIPFLGACIVSKGIEASPVFLSLVRSAYYLHYMQ